MIVPIDVPRIDARVFIADSEFPLQLPFPIDSLDHEDLALRIRGPGRSTVRLEIRRRRDDSLVGVAEKQMPANGELDESTRILFKEVFDKILDVGGETRVWVVCISSLLMGEGRAF